MHRIVYYYINVYIFWARPYSYYRSKKIQYRFSVKHIDKPLFCNRTRSSVYSYNLCYSFDRLGQFLWIFYRYLLMLPKLFCQQTVQSSWTVSQIWSTKWISNPFLMLLYFVHLTIITVTLYHLLLSLSMIFCITIILHRYIPWYFVDQALTKMDDFFYYLKNPLYHHTSLSYSSSTI